LKNKYSVYFGSRELKESKIDYKFHRKFLGLIFRFYSGILLGINLKDTQCGYKLYRTKVAQKIFKKLKSNGFEHDLEIVMLLKKNNITIKELPVHWTHKNDSKLNIFYDPLKMLIGIFKIAIIYRLIK
jgi:dolichyl-phosphate beta-glucosyltransferase